MFTFSLDVGTIEMPSDDLSNLVAVEDLLIAVQCPNQDDIQIIQAEAAVNLDKFNLTPQEIYKFQLILKELNSELAKSLEEQHPAVSVISEIRSKSGKNLNFNSLYPKTDSLR